MSSPSDSTPPRDNSRLYWIGTAVMLSFAAVTLIMRFVPDPAPQAESEPRPSKRLASLTSADREHSSQETGASTPSEKDEAPTRTANADSPAKRGSDEASVAKTTDQGGSPQVAAATKSDPNSKSGADSTKTKAAATGDETPDPTKPTVDETPDPAESPPKGATAVPTAKATADETPLIPPPAPRFKSPEDAEKYVGLLQSMVDAVAKHRTDGLQNAKRFYDQARALADDDPRAEYLYALVLHKALKYDEALNQFDVAATKKTYPYPPSRQAAAWLRVSRKQIGQAMDEMTSLARVLATSKAEWPDEHNRVASAIWIGRMLGYLEHVASLARKDSDLVTRQGADIEKLLKGRLDSALQIGRAQIVSEFEQSQTSSGGEIAQAEAENQKKQEAAAEQLAGKKQVVDEEKLKLTSTQEEKKRKLDAQLADFDKQLSELERSYTTLAAQGQALSQSITRLEGEIGSLEMLAGSKPTAAQENQLQGKRNTLGQLRGQYNVLDRQAAGVKQQATGVIAQRASAVAQYQRETGDIIKKSESLAKWDKVLAAKEERAAKTKPTKSATSRAVDAKLRALSTYLTLDFEAETRRVLESYGPVSGDKSAGS